MPKNKKAKIGGRYIEDQAQKEETGTSSEIIQKRISKYHEDTNEIWLNANRVYDVLKDEDVEENDVLRNIKETSRNCISPCRWYSKKDIIFMLSEVCGMDAKSEEDK